MRKIALMVLIALVAFSVDAGKAAHAAVGVPENIVLYRDFDPGLGFPQIFVQKRFSANDFSTSGDPGVDFLQSTGTGAIGDQLDIGDVNGDGTDDLMVVQDVTGVSPFDWLTIAGFAVPANPPGTPDPVITGPGAANAQRTSGNAAGDTVAITRRDIDGDGLADTAEILNGNIQFAADVWQWSFIGSDDGVQSLPLNGSKPFYQGTNSGNLGQPVFGSPIGQESIPIVGDFNGDGFADRAISNNAGLVSSGGINGRQVQIDLSPGTAGDYGDGLPDNVSQVFGVADDVTGLFLDTDIIRAADINGDGLDDLVAIAPADLDDGNGGTIEVWELNGFINNGTFDGVTNAFDYDPNFDVFTGLRNLGDTIHFGAFGFLDLGPQFDPADLNQDGFVDGLDLGILLGNWNTNTTPDQGELNGTPPVDGLDLGILLGAWNPPPAAATAAVPEPTSIVLLGLAGIFAISKRRS